MNPLYSMIFSFLKGSTKIFKRYVIPESLSYRLLLGAALSTIPVSCTKLVEVDTPIIYTSEQNVYNTDANAIAVVNSIYASMSSSTILNGNSLNSFMSLYVGLSADEFDLFSGVTNSSYIAYYHNALLNSSGPNIWLSTYPYIFQINAAIEGVTASAGLSEVVRKELLGEAKFLRAFSYFYLVNLYGPVPLALSSDYKVNSLLSRSSIDVVYTQIISDLQDAGTLLSDNFVGNDGHTTSTERVVPNKWTAKALLARVYLYRKNYSDAVSLSTEVINNVSLFGLADLPNVFMKNSKEAIWQLQPVNAGWNTEDAKIFIIPSTGPGDNYPVFLSNNLVNSFEEDDQRMQNWVGTVDVNGISYKYPYKYKSASYGLPVTEYQMVLRLAEQYLIRSEANAQLNKISESISDLNVIKNRAGLGNFNGEENQADVLTAVYHENQIEFFSEWGHRWMDLKRTSMVDNVMNTITQEKGGTWNSYDQFYPVYISELQNDPNLTQTEGY